MNKQYVDKNGNTITAEQYYSRDENGECVFFEAYELNEYNELQAYKELVK